MPSECDAGFVFAAGVELTLFSFFFLLVKFDCEVEKDWIREAVLSAMYTDKSGSK